MEEEWKVNIKSKKRNVKLKDILTSDSNDYKTKNISINSEYLKPKINFILSNNYKFINFEQNNHYLNFTESEQLFIIQNNKDKEFTLENFSKISYNNEVEKKSLNISELKLNKWNIISSFRIKNMNNNKILNIFIYTIDIELDSKNITLYSVLTYYERTNIFLMLINSYIELLLYIYKIECEMGKNPKLSKVISSYPHEFRLLNLNDIKNYFNNLPKVWKNKIK